MSCIIHHQDPFFMQVQNIKSEIKYGICVKCYGLVCVEWQLVWLIYTQQIFQLSVSQIPLSECCTLHLNQGKKCFCHCCTYFLSDRNNGDNYQLCPYISHFLGIAGLIPSSNMFDTLYHKSNMSSGVPTGNGKLAKSQFHVYGLLPLMQL